MKHEEFLIHNGRKNIWEKRMPTLFAIFVLLFGMIVTLSFVKQGIFISSQATPSIVPQDVRFTNISDSSFSVTFITTEKTVGAVSLDGKEGASLATDDKAKTDDQATFYSHHITVGNLKPETKYDFSLISGNQLFNNSGKKYSVTTGPLIREAPSDKNPIFGTAILPNGEDASDALVIVSASGLQSVSASTKENGEFLIPVNSIRNISLDSYSVISDDTLFTLTLLQKDTKTSVTVSYKNSQNIAPITLSQNYDFSTDTKTNEASPEGELISPPPAANKGNITIQSPRDSQKLIDSKPLFRGTAVPGNIVKITINSEHEITAQTKTDSSGVWSYRPQSNLAPGEHTITIETIDTAGIIKKITQSFTVFASGTQVNQTATPSATPTLTLTLTPSPSATPTPTDTIIAPTFVPTVITPTLTVSPPAVFTSTTPTALPQLSPGAFENSVILTFISVLFIVSGAALLFVL